MAYLRARLAALSLSLALALVVVLAIATVARAEGAMLALDDPKSGFHFEVSGACLARPADAGRAGAATCPELAVAGVDSDTSAFVRGPGGAPYFSVDVITDVVGGSGEARARDQAARIGEALADAPTVVDLDGQRFVRGRITSEGGRSGAGICFVTADDRPEVTSIIFTAADPANVAEVERAADAAMATLRRTTPASALPAGAASVPGRGSDALAIALLVIVVGAVGLFVLLKIAFIARLFGFKLGGGDGRRVEEPHRPRDRGRDGPQVAGMGCAACKRNILSDFDGMSCADCDQPIHKKCHGKHVAAAHGPTPGAYR